MKRAEMTPREEFRKRARHLVARMLRELSVDRVVTIIGDAEHSYRLGVSPPYPVEVMRRDPQDPFRPSYNNDKVVDGLKSLTEDLVRLLMGE